MLPNSQPVDKFAGCKLVREIQLPSRGLLYNDAIRQTNGKIRVAALTTLEEKIFSGSGNTPESKLDMVFDRCVDCGDFPPRDMILGDRMFCLMHIRSLSYGDKYSFPFSCVRCGQQATQELDLLKDIPLTVADENFREPYEVTLPVSGSVVGLKYFRGSDESKVASYTEKNSRQGRIDLTLGDISYVYRLARHIVTVDGKQLPFKADTLKFVERLEGPDSIEFRSAVESHFIGFAMTVAIACKFCGFVHDDVGVPMTGEFFRPKPTRHLPKHP